MIPKNEIGGVLLAGGRASRMNYLDKALQPLHDRSLLAHVIDRASPQVSTLVLSVNHNTEHYLPFGLPLVADRDAGYHGPLLGIYSAMHWYLESADHRDIKYLACFAADVPIFPATVIDELAHALYDSDKGAAYVTHRGQIQPLFSLWRLSLANSVREAIASGLYGPKLIFDSIDAISVDCAGDSAGDFFNVNSSDDLATVARLSV